MTKITVAVLIAIAAVNINAQWRTLEPGLEFASFPSPLYDRHNDTTSSTSSKINVLRINLTRYELRLLNASNPATGGSLLTARRWAAREGMAAAVNAAMYQADYRTGVSHMKTSAHINNPRISKDKTILVFEPLQKGIPPARIVDLQCDDFEAIRPLYGSAVQSIRMLSCAGKNVWQESEKRWSIAAVATDKPGNILFIQCTAPHSVHEFVNILRELPISIDRAMYMEGGGPSQLFIGTAKDTMEFTGDFSSGGKPAGAAQLPNVLGVRRIK
ncbi:MAG: phosphodiester glycosidase family protein [Chitinispirillales bacterium]|jgi:uncharacterized protein YigE (DUF2233 family)|nr:phosphodiester glycosidase family protein [Chitinispirillales bacterium]